MREITRHKIVENDRQPWLFAGENVAPGNAPQAYAIVIGDNEDEAVATRIDFISIDKPGVTNEALLAVVIDRLEGFQSGPFACDENQTALDHARDSLAALHSRTRERFARGVENKHEK